MRHDLSRTSYPELVMLTFKACRSRMRYTRRLVFMLLTGSCIALCGCPKHYALRVVPEQLDSTNTYPLKRKITLAIREFDYEARFRGDKFMVVDHRNNGKVTREDCHRWAVDPSLLVNQLIRECSARIKQKDPNFKLVPRGG